MPGSPGKVKRKFLGYSRRPGNDPSLHSPHMSVPWTDHNGSNYSEEPDPPARDLSKNHWIPGSNEGTPLTQGLRASIWTEGGAPEKQVYHSTTMFTSIHGILDRLQQHLPPHLSPELQLPYIAVVGCQSGGKSSVMETIVGKDFLPRKHGLCTQRPLFIDLVRSDTASDYAVFVGPTEDTVMHDFNLVKREIERLTDEETRGTKIISPKPIELKIYSRDVVTMRLVDLPGITKVAIEGQPETIEADTTNMVLNYIENKNVIILAVIPANSDVANSDALKAAKMADPLFERTIGVLTKIDIMDKGTDVCGYLTNREKPTLKLGYTAVINRNAEDTRIGVSLKEHTQKEEAWFKSDPGSLPYRDIKDCGKKALLSKLNGVFIREVYRHMETMREIVTKEATRAKKTLETLKNPFDTKVCEKGELVRKIAKEYQLSVVHIINGTMQHRKQMMSSVHLRRCLQEFKGSLKKDAYDASKYDDEVLCGIIENSQGVEQTLEQIDKPLAQLVVKVVDELEDKCNGLVNKVQMYLKDISQEALNSIKDLGSFSKLSAKFHQIFEKVIDARVKKTKMFIRHRLDTEKLLNTNHKNFIGLEKAITSVKQNRFERHSGPLAPRGQGSGRSEREEAPPIIPPEEAREAFPLHFLKDKENIGTLRILLESYCRDVVADSLAHGVPNTILVGLVKHKLDLELEEELQKMLIDPDLMVEDECKIREREKYEQLEDSCTRALNFINVHSKPQSSPAE